jgi:hypothetical protein
MSMFTYDLLNSYYVSCSSLTVSRWNRFLCFVYIRDGFIEEANPEYNGPLDMVPHRPVFREQAETTKVRPVFDGSVHHKGRRSFNANLEVGPNMKTHIMGILMRFRPEKQEEGEKAFLQILIHPDHCQIVRFIWVDDLNAENPTFKVYCWKRLSFWLTSSLSLGLFSLNT